ncbi:serine/threonine-protein kinase [Nonomuraea sp. NPDC059194]|uniref:serine/threonine-protein kinase n=1 Tax=Nonomuraea sp. NPDC059194 TaxID=3346764 RepID=UPI0036A3E713
MTFAETQKFGPYATEKVLGSGGQGTVYLGRGPTGDKVAIKVLLAAVARDEGARRRFHREAEATRQVAAFCTARVLDAGVEGDLPYIVSEYIPGPSLDELVATEGPRTGGGLQRLAVATLTALDAIHRGGIVHRDFKPKNVIMGPEGPVVIDFGIARAAEHTATSTVMGTPAFMAPEQFEGTSVTGAADLFSWAATMLYAATGRLPFRGDTAPSLMHAILTTEPDLSGVPDELRPILHACLHKDPAARPTAEALLGRITGAVRPHTMGSESAPVGSGTVGSGTVGSGTVGSGTVRLPEGEQPTSAVPSHPTSILPPPNVLPAQNPHPGAHLGPRPAPHAAPFPPHHPGPYGYAPPRPPAPSSGKPSLVAGTFAFVAAVPLLVASVVYSLSIWERLTTDGSFDLPHPVNADLIRSMALAVVVVPLFISMWRASRPAAIVGLAPSLLVVLVPLRFLPSRVRHGLEDVLGFDLAALLDVALLLEGMAFLTASVLLWRWSRAISILGVLSGGLQVMAGAASLLEDPRDHGLVALLVMAAAPSAALWCLATAGVVIMKTMRARSAALDHLT